jgi:hypothetical protein
MNAYFLHLNAFLWHLNVLFLQSGCCRVNLLLWRICSDPAAIRKVAACIRFSTRFIMSRSGTFCSFHARPYRILAQTTARTRKFQNIRTVHFLFRMRLLDKLRTKPSWAACGWDLPLTYWRIFLINCNPTTSWVCKTYGLEFVEKMSYFPHFVSLSFLLLHHILIDKLQQIAKQVETLSSHGIRNPIDFCSCSPLLPSSCIFKYIQIEDYSKQFPHLFTGCVQMSTSVLKVY